MLEFDAYQRSETVSRILRDNLLQPGSRVLDVGGYPGRLRTLMPEYSWVICDPLVDAPGEQVIGDACVLPFGDEVFEMSVSLDVLEHIQSDNRNAYINEISRVSKKGFLLSFPYAHPLVELAEDSVRKMYEEKNDGKTHPWLEEHKQYGLPDVDEVMSITSQLGISVQQLHVGAVHRWQLLQTYAVLIENYPAAIDFASKIDTYYKEHVYPNDFVFPTYRVVLVCTKQENSYTLPASSRSKESLQVDVELQTFLMRTMALLIHSNRVEKSETECNDLSSEYVREYISRLETGLQLWEDTCAKLNQRICEEMEWRERIESNAMVKMYRRLRKLFRR